ncbi:hypothetical protein VTN49DRAFT_2246 [Thermomyces lanuginosus]|uniref:uncharacterized protein n=1 Tax=Thermomyces lanuginosus TaxID=5541 RepID=UPI00374318FD
MDGTAHLGSDQLVFRPYDGGWEATRSDDEQSTMIHPTIRVSPAAGGSERNRPTSPSPNKAKIGSDMSVLQARSSNASLGSASLSVRASTGVGNLTPDRSLGGLEPRAFGTWGLEGFTERCDTSMTSDTGRAQKHCTSSTIGSSGDSCHCEDKAL